MIAPGIGFWKGAGIPRGPRSNIFVECGCCGAYHREDFSGDCREDSERFPSSANPDWPPDEAVIVDLEVEP